MKVLIQEHEGCFSIDLNAETLGEAALLTRMGVDARERINHLATYVQKGEGANGNASDVVGKKDELFAFNCTLAKAKKANSYMPRRIPKRRR